MTTPLQEFVYLDKYSRYRYDLGRRETWEETVDRSYNFLRYLVEENTDYDLSQHESMWKMLHDAMLNMSILPSMRLMASAGEAARRDNAMIYNCSYLTIDSVDSFPEVLALSMAGVGVGYSVEKQYVDKLPVVMLQSGNVRYHTIDDSTEGWVDAFRLGIHSWWNGDDVVFNYDELRPAGAILKIKGGRASGPDVLRELLDFTRSILLEHQGRKLSPINAHDIVTKIGDCVVAGGVRRTAFLALFDHDDERMATCKSPENIVGHENRYNANNSLVMPNRHITQKEIYQWLQNMLDGGTGEPGLFNRNVKIPNRREQRDDFGPNACLPEFTPMITPNGIRQFKDIDVGDTIWGKNGWTKVVKKWYTGNKPVFEYRTTSGRLYSTDNHHVSSNGGRVEIGEAEKVDSLLGPEALVAINQVDVDNGVKAKCNCAIPDEYYYGDATSVSGFLLGLKEGDEVLYTTESKELAYKVVEMLGSIGVRSYISNGDSVYVVSQEPSEQEDSIVEILELGEMPVYELTVDDDEHYFWSGNVCTSNCAEIVLRPRQFCNLTTVVVRKDDTIKDLLTKVHLATILGTIQSLATSFKNLGGEWVKNAKEERLLGVSITGYFDSKLIRQPDVLKALKYRAIATNKMMADAFGINQSVAVTAIKPSGNSSQLVDASSGIHPRWSQYYIRRVRVNVESPIYKVLKSSGVKMFPENGQRADSATTWVVSFPVRSPDESITKDDLNAVSMLNHWLNAQQNYCEHNVSVTIPYTDDEWIDIANWVYNHQNEIAGITFIPKSNAHYEQMPYEEITKEQYEKMVAEMPEIDWDTISQFENADMTEASHEVACSAGVCEADFFGLEDYGKSNLDFIVNS